ncbi:MAG: hypothetical protein RIR47_108 [Bacteroidota bacterium]|jgi:hypothetical protein
MQISCTAIPIYPPDYDYAIQALITHNKNINTKLYFIFTNLYEYNLFYNKIVNLNLNHLKWDKIILGFQPKNNENIITIKKFYAVNQLLKEYQYVGVFDCETLFVKPMDTDIVYASIDQTRYFKSNYRFRKEHLIELSQLVGYNNDSLLINETENFSLYWWFNEICVYEKNKFNEFFEWLLKHENYNQIITNFISFDFLLYSIWLICNKGYRLKKYLTQYSLAGAAVETNYCDNNVSYEFMSYQDRNINHEQIEHIKVQIMIDRGIEHCSKEGERRWIG